MLGIDAGERRVGVALSDELRLIASPVTVLDRRGGLAGVMDALSELVRREEVSEAVVGLPLNADGSEGRQARRARDFARVASRVTGIRVLLWDERLSTRAAEDALRVQGRNLRRLRQRGQIDAYAAALILQDYLDHGCRGSTSADAECRWTAERSTTGGTTVGAGEVSSPPDPPLGAHVHEEASPHPTLEGSPLGNHGSPA